MVKPHVYDRRYCTQQDFLLDNSIYLYTSNYPLVTALLYTQSLQAQNPGALCGLWHEPFGIAGPGPKRSAFQQPQESK